MARAWATIAREAAAHFRTPEGFPLRAYSEFMPPPWVALKPYDPVRPGLPALEPDGFAIGEFEEAHELRPGLERIAAHVVREFVKLVHGGSHALSRALLRDNPAWPATLAAGAPALALETYPLVLPLALSRTQDDKGRVRWTLFGSSHAGPARAFWRSFADGDPQPFLRLAGWWLGLPAPASLPELGRLGFRVLRRTPDAERPELNEGEVPAWVRSLRLGDGEPIEQLRTLLSFEPFERLPGPVQAAYLRGTLRLLPWPGSLLFWEHPGYRRLAAHLPWAMQVPLLHLFPRSESNYGMRIPQSGWLDEGPPSAAPAAAGHRLAHHVVRSHRFQRLERDADPAADETFADRVAVALFSTQPDDLGLYGKPMGRNVQVWTEDYEPLLDGPSAAREELESAARRVQAGGRFGYRFLFPPMQAGARALFWHRPLVARLDPLTGAVVLPHDPLRGIVTAERPGAPPIELAPRVSGREVYREAAALFERDPGRTRFTTAGNVRKLLEWSDLLGGPLPPSLARALLDAGKDVKLDEWLDGLPGRASEPEAGRRVAAGLRTRLGGDLALASTADGLPDSRTFGRTRERAFEERLWRTMAFLSGGRYCDKDNADRARSNARRTGGTLGRTLGRLPAGRDLDALGDWLHEQYRELIGRHGMAGRAAVVDQRFRWETDFELAWSDGWSRSQGGDGSERNVVLIVPGRDERQAVVLADHYDTAYMEDLYEPSRGGDLLRAAAAGADDNHSATAALLAAADVLLPLSREGRLARTVWLVHLTGEEFPADCLGARALVRGAVRGDLRFTTEDGGSRDVSGVRLRGAYVMDMIGHNHDRDRDTFQIAPGEGPGSARLARIAHLANERWNRSVPAWNRESRRQGKGRAVRRPDGREPPPIAEHLALLGEVRPEWEPRSALYNTDGQIFSDAGVPVVLFMENYDLSRAGYHDTHDTMENIDLDYAAALAAIAIEATAEAACEEEP